MIVVTGAAGLIGSAVVRNLNKEGKTNLLLVDHLGTSEKWFNLRSLEFSKYMEKNEFLALIEQELKGEKTTDLENIEAIIHLGAQSSTTEKNVSYLIENNYRYSIQLAELASLKKIRMVYASSAATYGDGNQGFDDEIKDLEKLRPLNAYGYSKHLFDLWLLKKKFLPNFAGIKYFNVFGPNEYHKENMRSLVLKAYEQIQKTGKLALFKSYHQDYEDGKQKRDFLYVEDAAKMTVHLSIKNQKATGIFNAGSGIACTWLDLAHAIFNSMNKKMKIQFVDMPKDIRLKYQYYTCAPIQRLKETGFQEKLYSLEEGVNDYISYYLLTNRFYA